MVLAVKILDFGSNMLKYYKLHDDVKDPVFATEGSACFDLHCYLSKLNQITIYEMNNNKVLRFPQVYDGDIIQISIDPADRALIPTGLIFDIPEGHSVRLHTRSSISLKKGLIMSNSEGIIDSDYYHQAYIMLYNASADVIRITHGERIAQGELIATLKYDIEETTDVPEQKTTRVGGFGSTGV